MTTIAYKDGVVAYDSQASAGVTIVDDDVDKKWVRGESLFFMAGSPDEIAVFLDAFEDGEDTYPYIHDVNGILVEPDGLFSVGSIEGKIWKQKWNGLKPYAIGCGGRFAWGAMDMGATAERAVKVACRRDIYSGGRVRTFKIINYDPLEEL